MRNIIPSQFSSKLITLVSVFIIGLCGFGVYFYHHQSQNSKIEQLRKAQTSAIKPTSDTAKAADAASQVAASNSKPTTKTNKTSAQSSTSTPTPVQTQPATTPLINTTNCLPPNPSIYATYFIGMTNSQYLQTSSYANTTKIYNAFQFAGLLGTINSRQYVVLAMDDSAWNGLTQKQLDWMNASPDNMRSVIGWQVITSCITWNGVNPVKDMTIGDTRVVNTLNGPVTYTHGTSGLGTFGSGNVGIWDWFTSNGSVTIAGFVNLPQVP